MTRKRYHYQYAIFSATDFTAPAQRFAFAHDIHLLPLGNSTFFGPVIRAVKSSALSLAREIGEEPKPQTVATARRDVRSLLRGGHGAEETRAACAALLEACAQVGAAYLAMAGGIVPLLLVPESGLRPDRLAAEIVVRIRREKDAWYIQQAEAERRLFSFDLPQMLFALYAESGSLDRAGTAQFKADYFQEIQLTSMVEGRPRLHVLRLDANWISDVTEQLDLT